MANSETASDLRATSVRGGLWAAAGAAGSSGAALVSFLFLSRLLPPEVFGMMAMIEAALAAGQQLLSSGLSEPLIQMRKLEARHADTLFWALQILGAGLAAGLAVSAGPLSHWFGRPELQGPLVVVSVSVWLQAVGLVPRAMLIREFRFAKTARATVWSEGAGGALAILAAFGGLGIWSLVLQRITASATEAAILWHSAGWRPQLNWCRAAFADVWRFSASRGLEGLLHYADMHAPRIILGRVAGATELGYFIFARRIIENSINVLITPAKHAALPAFATVQTEMDRVRRGYASGVGLTTAIVIPACAGIGLVAPLLVPLMAGSDWMPSVFLLQLLVLTSYRRAFHVWNAALLRGLGRPGLLLYASFLRSSAILLGMYLLLPWGAVGVCLAAVAGQYVSWPVAIGYVRQVTGLSVGSQLRPGLAPLVCTLLMAGVVTGVRLLLPVWLGPVPALGILIVTGVLVYAVAMWFLGREQCQEVLRLLRSRSPADRRG